MQCIHIEGLIPFMSAMVQLMALWCSLSTLTNLSSSISDKEEDMMIEKVDEGPR